MTLKSRTSFRQWGEPLWQARRLENTSAQPLKVVDVAIVGGGLTGISAAFHLARQGVRTLVLEAAAVGEGASGRTGGIVLEGTATGTRTGAEHCVPALAQMVDELGLACELSLPGCWEIEHQAGNERTALPWRDHEESLGSDAPVRVARTVSGGSVEPRALLFGLARAAQQRGALIREQQPVRQIDLRRQTLQLDWGSVAAAYIVVALNAWSASMLSGLPTIHSALTYACATEPLSSAELGELGLGLRMPFYTADRPYLWGRVAAQGQIVFGAGLLFGTPERLERTATDRGDSSRTLDRLEDRVRRLHPRLAGVRIAARWAGPIAFTDDALPLLAAHPSNPAVLVAGAYAGHGVAFSVHAGSMLAAAIVQGQALPRWGRVDRV